MSNMFLTPQNVEFNSNQRVVCLIGFHVRGFVRNPDDFRSTKGAWVTVMGRRVDAVYWETACDNPDLVALEIQGTAIIAFGWGAVEGRRRAIEQIRRSSVWVNGEIVRNAVMTIQRLIQIDPLNGQSVFVGELQYLGISQCRQQQTHKHILSSSPVSKSWQDFVFPDASFM